MYSINSRGTFMVSKYALPYLLKGENAHVLNLAPPIDLHPTWFKLGGTYLYHSIVSPLNL